MADDLSLAQRLRTVAAAGVQVTFTVTPDQARMLADACEGKPLTEALAVALAERRMKQEKLDRICERITWAGALMGAATGVCFGVYLVVMGIR